MQRSYVQLLLSVILLVGAVACRARESGRVDAAALEHSATGPELRVTILGNPDDPRIPPVREAIAHWNSELLRLGRRVRLDSGTVLNDSVPAELLRAASRAAMLGGGPATARLHATLRDVPADVV